MPNDLKFFKNTTWGMPIIIGRKTFESMGRPLPGRTNIVITRQTHWNKPGITVVKNIQDAMDEADKTDAKEAFIIGGGEIFKETLGIADKIYFTRVHAIVDGDTYLNGFNEEEWHVLSQLDFAADDKHAYPYTFQVLERFPTF